MSGVQTEAEGATPTVPPPANEEVERVARANGWKPMDEGYKGKPEDFVTADVFVARGLENPAILRDRNSVLTERLTQLERIHTTTKRDLEGKLNETLESLRTVTDMTRSAETRAYERARRELKAEQAKAVETGDAAAFQRVDQQLDELDKTRPLPAPVRTQAPSQQPGTQPTGAQPPPPEAIQFFAENPWYQRDPELQAEADAIHVGLKNNRPDLSLGQNLAEVQRRMRTLFPDRTGGGRLPGSGNGQQPAARQQQTEEEGRGNEPPAVTPSSGGAPRRAAQRNTFDSMPKESKDAFVRYAKQLEGKGTPLTKDEWAESYWSQFKDDGA